MRTKLARRLGPVAGYGVFKSALRSRAMKRLSPVAYRSAENALIGMLGVAPDSIGLAALLYSKICVSRVSAAGEKRGAAVSVLIDRCSLRECVEDSWNLLLNPFPVWVARRHGVFRVLVEDSGIFRIRASHEMRRQSDPLRKSAKGQETVRQILVGAEDVLPSQHVWYEGRGYSIYAAEQPRS